MNRHSLIVLLTSVLLVPNAGAVEWSDQPFKDLSSDVTGLLNQMKSGREKVSAQDIQDAIADVGMMMQQSIPNPAELQDFEANHCTRFKDDLQLAFGSMVDLSNGMLNLGSNDLGLALQDPGLIQGIGIVPCAVLFPVFKISQKVPILNGDVVMQASNAINVIDGLLEAQSQNQPVVAVAVIDDLGPGLGGDGSFSLAPVCTFTQANEQALDIARFSALGLGIVMAAVGTVLEVIGHTFLNGPDEVEAGAWGFAQVSVENDWTKAAGIFIKEGGKVLIQIAGSATRTVNHCRLQARFLALHQDHQTLQEAHVELQAGQKEIVRLLLTPQGRRRTDFCFEAHCDFPDR